MTIALLSGLLFGGSVIAGLVGSLTGLGGGVVLVPLLTIGFGVDMRYAIGASLISVIATSSGSAAAYVREGYSNVRVGMLLEIATCLGAIAGAALATVVPTSALAIVFGFVLLFSAIAPGHEPAQAPEIPEQTGLPHSDLGARLGLNSSYPVDGRLTSYQVHRVPAGFGIMGIAGLLSGLLGIGSGAVKVLAMDLAMGLPFKVSTTTSNFMIGVTAAASAGIYLHRGYVDPGLVMPVMLGVVVGSLTGAKLLVKLASALLRRIFRLVILLLSFEMIYSGWAGKI